MACFHPLSRYRTGSGYTVAGPSFVPLQSMMFVNHVPCGQCIGCRLERSRQWAVRCMHEAQLYEHNVFITLTYSDDYILVGCSLIKSDFQLFMKRLRSRISPTRIRFYYCGEYGDNFGRPHYHAIIFNYGFPDKTYWRKSPNGERIYRSALLEDLWPFGLSEIGSVTFQSSAYIARYIMKKRLGKDASEHYQGRLPEYTDMSRNGGIGRAWFQKYMSDIYPHDRVILDGAKHRPPRIYDGYYELLYPDEMATLKTKRKRSARARKDNNTPSRLEVREAVTLAKINQLKRGL